MTTESVVIVRNSGSGFNAEGDPIAGTETTTTITGCKVEVASSLEPTERGREGVVTDWTVYIRGQHPDVLRTDLIEIRGVRCTITGEVGDWRGTPGGTTINAKRGVG